ncbi:MAG: TIGR03545 family protein [Planctomycetaceae bacterium]|nr:TIGR03545 family protein [Planctomycetaceae bacterium]
MRWSYVIPRLIIVAIVWAFLTWGKDPLMHYATVQTLQSVTGARVDVASIRSQVYPPRLVVDGVALASASRPGTNMVQFDSLELRLAGDPLLRRQFVVEEGHIRGVRFHTARSDDGQLDLPPEPEEENSEPSWMEEQLRSAGEEWLTGLLDQAKAQIDPNRLETYRTGTEVYEKWDQRFDEMTDRAKLLKPRFEQLKLEFDQARRGDPLRMVEQYLQIARKAEQLSMEAKAIREELTGIAPEVRVDFARLDQARQNDQQMVRETISMMKPDTRRVTESLIGQQMYLQLQQLLSWIELARQYKQELAEQTEPERQRGEDFEFPLLNPTPDFHLQNLTVSGEVEIDGELVPFEAQLADVTEDAPLLGRPCVFRLRTDSNSPITMMVTYDARLEKPVTQIQAAYSKPQGQPLATGKPEKAMLTARLGEVSWGMDLTVVEKQIAGRVQLQSVLHDASLTASEGIRPEFLTAAREALNSIHQVNASMNLGGTLLKPTMRIESDLGKQIVDGVQLAFAHQIDQARERLIADVNAYATNQVSKLSTRFSSEFQRLRDDNAELIAQVQEVQSIVATFRSGKVDINTLARTASNSQFLSDKQKQQVDRTMNDMNAVMSGGLPDSLARKIPGGSVENAIPNLINKSLPGDASRILSGPLSGSASPANGATGYGGQPVSGPLMGTQLPRSLGTLFPAVTAPNPAQANATGVEDTRPSNSVRDVFPGLRLSPPKQPNSPGALPVNTVGGSSGTQAQSGTASPISGLRGFGSFLNQPNPSNGTPTSSGTQP